MPSEGSLNLAKDENEFDNAIAVCGICGIKNKQNENPNRLDPVDIEHCVGKS